MSQAVIQTGRFYVTVVVDPEMEHAVNHYLDNCKAAGRQPEKETVMNITRRHVSFKDLRVTKDL